VAFFAFLFFSCCVRQSFRCTHHKPPAPHLEWAHFSHAPTPLRLVQVIVVVAPTPPPPRCVATLRLAVLPVALFAPDHIVVIDTGTSDARATGARVLVRSPEPDHVLQCVISIPRYQLPNDADNPNGDDDAATYTPMSTHTLPQGPFACAFLHLLRLHRCALALALLPPISSDPTRHMLCVESECWPPSVVATATAATHPSITPGRLACSFGKPLNAGAPEFEPNTFSFTPPPNMPTFPLPQPPPALPTLPSPPPATNVDTDSMRVQQGRKKHQRRSLVGFVDPSEASEDSRKVMTSFEFPQESPPCKSAPPSPTQGQGDLDAAAIPFTLPGLGGIDLGVTKESLLHAESPVSEGQDSEDDEAGEEK
jgi:hypothetical protein